VFVSQRTEPQKLPSVTWITIRSTDESFRAEEVLLSDSSQSTCSPAACAVPAHATASAHASTTSETSFDPMIRARCSAARGGFREER
jgi:hypothetical protein